MSKHRAALRAVVAACVLTALVAACGGDDGSADAPETTAPTTAAPTTEDASDATTTTVTEDGPSGEEEPEEPDDPEALARAESVIFTADDFAEGWVAEPPDTDEDEDDITECFRDVDADEVTLAEVESDTFNLDGEDGASTLGVSSTGVVFVDEASAEAVLAEVATNAFAGCALDLLLSGFEDSGLEVEDADLSPAPGAGSVGEETAVLNGFFVVTDGSESIEGELSLWFARTGDVVSVFNVFGIGDTVFAPTVDEAASFMADKHAAL